MTVVTYLEEKPKSNPIDVAEQLIDAYDWTFERRSDKEMAVQVPGRWCDYSMYFAWNDDVGAMHFTCAFDMRVPEDRRTAVFELLAVVNEKLWLGHFCLWEEEGLPMYRHGLPLRGVQRGVSVEQLEDLLETAVQECERFYPAFQYVLWAGKTPQEAIAMSLIDTVGEA